MASLDLNTLESILETLCPQCTPRHYLYESRCLNGYCSPTCQGRDEDRHRVRTLAALCLASRQVSALATPHLYHRPTCAQWPLLARTLLSRPDVARCVRHLCTRDWISTYEVLSRPLPQVPPEVKRYWDERALRHAEAAEDGDEEPFESEDMALRILLPLCPGVVALDAVVHSRSTFSSLGSETLSRLESVALAHWDTEFGLDLAGLHHLVRAAPYIRTVVGWQVSSCRRRFDLDNVTRLRLGMSSISLDHLRSVLLSCPHLEELKYRGGGSMVGYEQFTPLEMQDVLVEIAPRLKSLVLDLDGAYSHEHVLGEGWVLRSLAGLGELQRLEIETRCLVPHQNPMMTRHTRGPDGRLVPVDPGPIPGVGEGALIGLLPESICELTIWRGVDGPELVKLRAALAGLAASGRFERLRRVSVEGVGADNVEGVREAFERRDITFVVQGIGR